MLLSMLRGAPCLGECPVPPVWVLGGADDAMIMPPQTRDVASYFGTQAVILHGVAHDIMLVRETCPCSSMSIYLNRQNRVMEPASAHAFGEVHKEARSGLTTTKSP